MKILVLAILLVLVLDVKALFRPRLENIHRDTTNVISSIGSLGSNILLIPVEAIHGINPMLPNSGNPYYPVPIQPGYPDQQWYPNAAAATEPWNPNAGYPNAAAPTQPSNDNPAINEAGGGGVGGSLATPDNRVSTGASGHEARTIEEHLYQENR